MRVDVLALDWRLRSRSRRGARRVPDRERADRDIGAGGATVRRPHRRRSQGRQTAQGFSVPVTKRRPTVARLRRRARHRIQDARAARGGARAAGRARQRDGAAPVVRPGRDHDRGVHRHVRDGRIGPARPATRDHDVVAGAALSHALSERRAGRLEHDRHLRPLRDGGRRAESHRPGVVADQAPQSTAGFAHRQVSDRRFAAVAVRVRAHRSPDSLRSDRAAFRNLGAGQAGARVFTGCGGAGDRCEQAHAGAPDAARARTSRRSRISRACASNARCICSKTGDASVDDIAARVGYGDGATLRALLRRELKLGIKEIKRDATATSPRGRESSRRARMR